MSGRSNEMHSSSNLEAVHELLSLDFLDKYTWEEVYVRHTVLQSPEQRLLFAVLVDGLEGYANCHRQDIEWLLDEDSDGITSFNNCWWIVFKTDPQAVRQKIISLCILKFRYLLKDRFRINKTTG